MRRSFHLAAGIAATCWLFSGTAHAQTLDDVIAANLKSKGGVEKIKATTSVRMTGAVTARDRTGHDLNGTLTMVAKRPNLMRRDADVDGQRITNAFDGTSLWMAVGTAPPQELPGSKAAYARQDTEFDSVFVDYKEKGHKLELVGKETLAETPVYHVKVTKKGGQPQDYYLDAVTGLEKKISASMKSPDGSPMLAETEFSDYRSVDGVLVPFLLRQRQNGTLIATTTLSKVEFNVPIEESYFRMPAK